MSAGREVGKAEGGERREEAGLVRWEGRPVEAWREAWDVPRLEAHERLSTTNDRLRRWIREGAEPFSVVIAEKQTRGRGRRGRRWHSPAGQGLWLSTVLPRRTRGARETEGCVGLLVGCAAARAIDGATGKTTWIEWPNDLILRGGKVGGILCEAVTGRGIVAGVGINVRQRVDDFPPGIRDRASSLRIATGRMVGRGPLAGDLVAELRTLFLEWPATSELPRRVVTELRRRDALRGRNVVCEIGVEGVARGIGADGALMVEERGSEKTVRVEAGSVRATDGPGRGTERSGARGATRRVDLGRRAADEA